MIFFFFVLVVVVVGVAESEEGQMGLWGQMQSKQSHKK